MDYPRGDPPSPIRLFFQQILANVCTANIFDIDKDGQFEFVILMTDRVGSLYYFFISFSPFFIFSKIPELAVRKS